MLNDIFSYSCGKIIFGDIVDTKLSPHHQRQQSLQRTKRIYALNNSDPIFSAIRNSHMISVFPFLISKTKFLQMSFDRIAGQFFPYDNYTLYIIVCYKGIQKIGEMKNFITNELGKLRDQQRQLEMVFFTVFKF